MGKKARKLSNVRGLAVSVERLDEGWEVRVGRQEEDLHFVPGINSN